MAEATVVLDTNVWISGVLWAGIPARIVASIESELLTSAVTQELITELLEVLSRPKFERRLAALRSSPGEVVDAVVSVCQIVSRAPLAQPVLRDVDDDEVLACAQACGSALDHYRRRRPPFARQLGHGTNRHAAGVLECLPRWEGCGESALNPGRR